MELLSHAPNTTNAPIIRQGQKCCTENPRASPPHHSPVPPSLSSAVCLENFIVDGTDELDDDVYEATYGIRVSMDEEQRGRW